MMVVKVPMKECVRGRDQNEGCCKDNGWVVEM